MSKYYFEVGIDCKEISFGDEVKGVWGVVWYLISHAHALNQWDFNLVSVKRLYPYEARERKEYERLKSKFTTPKEQS